MSDKMALAAIPIAAVCTFLLRALPFVAFAGERKMPLWLERLGGKLPAAIMAVLVIYCLKAARTNPLGTGIRQLIAAAVVAVSYKWRHNTLLSIFLGTAAYMLLLRFL